MRLLHATTVPATLQFLAGQVSYLRDQGVHVSVLSSPGPELEEFAEAEGATALPLPMSRSISPRTDLITLLSLVRTLRAERPDILHAHTPKAGLLATIAGRIAGVPMCIYQIHGLRYMTAKGSRRLLLRTTERIACLMAHRVLAVSPSVLAHAEDERLIRRGKGAVIGQGTINGIDVEYFAPEAFRNRAATEKASLGIPEDAPVIGFIGRLVADKGVAELVQAWGTLRDLVPDAHLLLIGDPESEDPVDPSTMEFLREDPRAHLPGFRFDVRPLLATMTVLALPSHREGFGHALLEAAAMEVPTVGSDIPGISDAIADGRTGLLFPVHDVEALTGHLLALLRDPALRAELGKAGRRRAITDFDRREVRRKFLDYYQTALWSRSGRHAAPLAPASEDFEQRKAALR
jgi:glycosyltransferase involved in cell wall biosynthesis